MRLLAEVDLDRAPGVEADPQIPVRFDLLNEAGLPVGDVTLPQRCRELNAIACGEFAFLPFKLGKSGAETLAMSLANPVVLTPQAP